MVMNNGLATQTTATSNGDWSEPAIWTNGVPGCIDTVIILAGVQVDITSTVDLEDCPDSMLVFVYGTIEFQNGRKLKLPCNSDVLVFTGGSMGVGSGGGNSTYLEICSIQYWNAADGNLVGPQSLCNGSCPPSQLPIELLYFTANWIENEREVLLSWSTLSESDNDYFTIERSVDGVDWDVVREVDGAGTSSSTLKYSTVDEDPHLGVSYYRLKQTDFNGAFKYSPIVSLNKISDTELIVYPNPASIGQGVAIFLPTNLIGEISVQVYSVEGKLVFETTHDASASDMFILDVTDSFQSGSYLIILGDYHTKLLVQ